VNSNKLHIVTLAGSFDALTLLDGGDEALAITPTCLNTRALRQQHAYDVFMRETLPYA
jgi:hypothetical protein